MEKEQRELVKEECLLEGRPCRVFLCGSGPLLFWGVQSRSAESCDALAEALARSRNLFTLVAFETQDWNAELSPWQAPPAFGSDGFAGRGRETLDWLERACRASSLQDGEARLRFLGGYSLSGLFSLWTLYESRLFSGAACCSGSLWFPGWGDYANNRTLPKDSLLYLSLGKKEEHTRNRVMATVGEQTRKQAALASEQLESGRFTLHWEEGGHFSEPTRRLLRGFEWLLSAEKRECD